MPDRSPAPRPALPLANAPPAAPVRAARGAAAPTAPAPDIDIESLVTEDDTPVDNLPSEKQQRLLTEPLYSSWAGPGGGRRFLAAANVGVFPERRNPAIVPDVLLSLDVQVHKNWWDKEHRTYFVWEFGKVPDLVVEIVSNRKGDEVGEKRMRYARMGVGYYVVSDPLRQVMDDELRVYRLSAGSYELREGRPWFPELGLGMTLWEGEFEGVRNRWLRWTDAQGELIPTGKQRAEEEAAARQQEAAARQAAEIRAQQEAAARQQEAAARQQEAAARRQEAAARQAAETLVQQEAAARQAAEARVAELEALLGRRST